MTEKEFLIQTGKVCHHASVQFNKTEIQNKLEFDPQIQWHSYRVPCVPWQKIFLRARQ